MHGIDAAGAEYGALRSLLIDVVGTLSPTDLATPVPSCPGWSVKDTIAHLVGGALDAVHGVDVNGVDMRGPDVSGIDPAPSFDSQSARHVADRRDASLGALLAEWQEVSPGLESLLDSSLEPRLIVGGYAVPTALVDVATHYDDICAALGRPPGVSPVHRALPIMLFDRWSALLDDAGLENVLLIVPTNDPWAGELESPLTFRAAPRVLYRAAMGRRSRSQIESYFVEGRPTRRHVDLLCVFGPSADDLTG